MPDVKRAAVLAKVYASASAKIKAGDFPSVVIQAGQTLYRSVNPLSSYTSMPKPAAGTHLSKILANSALAPSDGLREGHNRFSGPSGNPTIPYAGGLYCVQQQQALINESIHYNASPANSALSGRCVLQIKVMGAMLVAELSPHNPGALRFLTSLSPRGWNEMVDPQDCSFARGIGLAIAHSGLRGISVQTVRPSDRSVDEMGDNLVLFGPAGQPIAGLYVEQALYFENTNKPEIFPVAFP